MKSTIQATYNRARAWRPCAAIANFLIARERCYRQDSQKAVAKALDHVVARDSHSFVTAAGMFKNMLWPKVVVVGSEFAPKVLGTYELEIQSVFHQTIVEKKATSFVDIGAAEGYYAVGAALLRPSVKVLAYELKTEAHDGIRELAALNGVESQVQVFGLFQQAKLDRAALGDKPCVLVDIDGGEAQLVDESFADYFRCGTIIVEIHDFAVPGIGRRLRSMLSRTHDVRVVQYQPRIRAKARGITGLTTLEWKMVTDERRPRGNYWLIAEPRNAAST